jgi:hypothetical protein
VSPKSSPAPGGNGGEKSVQANTPLEKSLADLKKEHEESYAKALIHIAQDQNAPEHSKLKELTTKIAKADGLDGTTYSVSDDQKKRFAEIKLSSLNPWQISNELAAVAFEYIAAIQCQMKNKGAICTIITVNMVLNDITEAILKDLNDNFLPKPARFIPVPAVKKSDEQFKEFMAAVVLAHIMQKDNNQ